MSQSSEDMKRLQQLLEIMKEILSIPKDLIEQSLNNNLPNYKEDKGVVAIMKHIAKGGILENLSVPTEVSIEVEDKFKRDHIPYIKMDIMTDLGEKKSIFFFRDTDINKVRIINEDINIECSKNSHELDFSTFERLMKGKEISIVEGLSAEQIYAFRVNTNDYSLNYCVGEDKNGNYKILSSNPEETTKVLIKMCYDLKNDNGNFKSDVLDYQRKREDLLSKFGKNSFIICDKKNPNNFIRVTEKNYTLHSLQAKEEKDLNGNMQIVIRDVLGQKNPIEKEMLLETISRMNNPVYLEEQDFPLVKSFSKNIAYAADNILEIQEDFQKNIKSMEPVLSPYPKLKPKYKESDLEVYSHLPLNIIQKMEKDLPFIEVDKGMHIIFDKKYKHEVDEFLEKEVFSQIQDPLQRISFEWQMRGRTGDFRAPLTGDVDEAFYIINPDYPEFVVNVDRDGIHIFENNIETKNCSCLDENYNRFMNLYLDKEFIKNPVVLTEIEMSGPDRIELINERANGTCFDKIKENFVQLEQIEKAELVEHIDDLCDFHSSKQQQKAIDEYEKIHVSSKYIDNAVFEELQPRNVSREKTIEQDIDFS